MFAAKAGAAKVVGVDRSRILKTALQIIKYVDTTIRQLL